MKLLIALGLLFVATGSTGSYAQDEDLSRYYPLGLGDTWIYGNYEWDCVEKECDLQSVLVRRTVLEEVEISGETYAAVEVSVLHSDTGAVLCTSTYGARLDVFDFNGETTALVDIVDIDPPCLHAFLPGVGDTYLEELRSLTSGIPSMQTVHIGGTEYDLMIRSDWFDPDLREVNIAFGQDVGLLEINWFRDIGPGFSENGSFSLRYAEVGGVTYGVSPVAGEPSPRRLAGRRSLSIRTQRAVQ